VEKERDHIDAIYELREAVETKVELEHALRENPSAEGRDTLLDAQLSVEAKTQDAIEACEDADCGHAHPHDVPVAHERVRARQDNVVAVDFRDHDHDIEGT